MVDAGQIKPEEALSHPDAHFLTRCLGTQVELDVPLQQFWREPSDSQDSIVLCSDGLYGLVSDQEIAEAVRTRTPEDACQALIDLANSRGGYDNITLSIVPLQGVLTDQEPAEWDKVRTARQRQRSKLNRPPLAAKVHAIILMSLGVVAACATTIVFAIQKSLIS
jgi:serine/threonine protein phosphatase PrpC